MCVCLLAVSSFSIPEPQCSWVRNLAVVKYTLYSSVGYTDEEEEVRGISFEPYFYTTEQNWKNPIAQPAPSLTSLYVIDMQLS